MLVSSSSPFLRKVLWLRCVSIHFNFIIPHYITNFNHNNDINLPPPQSAAGVIRSILIIKTKLRHTLDRFSVDLERTGGVEFDGDVLARTNLDLLFVLDVLTLEERGEDHKSAELACVVEDAA